MEETLNEMVTYRQRLKWDNSIRDVCVGIAFLISGSSCNDPAELELVHPTRLVYSGDKTCVACHVDIHDSYTGTAHYASSHPFTASDIKNRDTGQNSIVLNDSIHYKIVEKKGIFLQEGYFKDSLVVRRPFDITVGSGKRGQTFLFWEDSLLFQLPVSRFAKNGSWVNSPGYPTDRILFNRPVLQECMACHATHMEPIKDRYMIRKNIYDTQNVMLGISCEKCHGPAKNHVDFHTKNPSVRTANAIQQYSELSRQQKMDVCALCHSGPRDFSKSPFAFMVGDSLNGYSRAIRPRTASNSLDVHANQYGLFVSSKCFINSETMDCATCHDVHEDQVGNLKMFSAKCVSCHDGLAIVACGLGEDMRHGSEKNCIDCHMPNLATNAISIFDAESKNQEAIKIRTHKIGIYGDKKVEDKIRAYVKKL